MGFNVPEPDEYSQPLPDLVGPLVHLGVCTSTTWNAVVLCAYKRSKSSQSNPVTCEWKIQRDGAKWRGCESVTLDAHRSQDAASGSAFEWQFIRFTLPTVPLKDEQVLSYRISVDTIVHHDEQDLEQAFRTPAQFRTSQIVSRAASIPIPAANKEWRVVATSCYDQRRGVGKRLWKNIAENAARGEPVHALLGGGDQLYNDNVWTLDPLQEWLKDKDRDRLTQEPSEQTTYQIADFYVGSYLRYLHFHPAAELFRSTPQVNTWDDHDTFDGWGSYPPKLQNCPLFQAIFKQSQRFYSVFQLATTAQLAAADGFCVVPPTKDCPHPALNFASQLGPSLAVVAPDSRSQRSKSQILSDGTFNWIIMAMKQFPREVSHVVLLSAIPMLYPGLGILESLLNAFNNFPARLLFKTGLYDSIYNHFDQPELLDDVTDHWSSSVHVEEKAKLLTAIAATASQCQIRVSIASGDVHLCAFGYMQSKGQAGQVQALDPGFIPQIVTSAIGNKPPGNLVVAYIEKCTSIKNVGEHFQEGMAEIFDEERTPAKSSMFNNRQNYCELSVTKPEGALAGSPGNLSFKLVVLGGDPIGGDEIHPEDAVPGNIPPLLPSDASPSLVKQYADTQGVPAPKLRKKRGCLWCC